MVEKNLEISHSELPQIDWIFLLFGMTHSPQLKVILKFHNLKWLRWVNFTIFWQCFLRRGWMKFSKFEKLQIGWILLRVKVKLNLIRLLCCVLLQNGQLFVITQRDKGYYKTGQRLLQNGTGITKRGKGYYKTVVLLSCHILIHITTRLNKILKFTF